MKEDAGIHLEPLEEAEIRKADANLIRLKVALADVTLEAEVVEKKRKTVLRSIEKATKNYVDRVGGIARAHGIDPDDPKGGKWNFDAASMTFNRIG